MSILQVANVHFESTGSNRIDFDAGNNAMRFIATGSVSIPTNINLSGNLSVTSTGGRITGDFTTATYANRVMFQNSVLNARTNISALPNGTNTNAGVDLYNSSSDPANASLFRIAITNAEYQLEGSKLGTGSYLPMTFYTGGSERARIDTSGNVGIGTNSPATKLHVNGNITLPSYGQILPSDTTSGINISGSSSGYPNGGTIVFRGNNFSGGIATNGLEFLTDGSERMRIDSSGNVGIGTTTTNTHKLNVNGSANISGTLIVGGSPITAGLSGINNVATITANTTWTVPAGITKVKVTVIGGGGGGGSGGSNGQQYGKAGGFGGIAVGFVTGLTPGGTVSITVGAAGSGSTYGGTNAGATPQQNGTAGGTSSFGAYITCTGGAAGTYQAAAGGAATNGTTSGSSVLFSLPLPPTTLGSQIFRSTGYGIGGISGSSATGVAGTAGSGYGAPGGGGDVNSAYNIGQYAL